MPKIGDRFDPNIHLAANSIYIPDEICRMKISHAAKLYIGALGFMRHSKRPLTAESVSTHIGIGIRRTNDVLRELARHGLAEKYRHYTPEGAAELIQRKRPALTEYRLPNTCSWCNGGCAWLHRHHFPIAKKDGGVDTVEICPNCHTDFHYLVSERWTPKINLEQYYSEER